MVAPTNLTVFSTVHDDRDRHGRSAGGPKRLPSIHRQRLGIGRNRRVGAGRIRGPNLLEHKEKQASTGSAASGILVIPRSQSRFLWGRRSGVREDDELLGRSGHGDIAVDSSFDAVPNASGSTRTTRSNSSPFDSSGVSDRTRDVARNVGSPMTQAIPSACAASQVSRIEPSSEAAPCTTGTSAAADRRRHVGVRKHGPDDRLGFRHHLFGRPVVDAQGGQVDPVEPDPLEPFLP